VLRPSLRPAAGGAARGVLIEVEFSRGHLKKAPTTAGPPVGTQALTHRVLRLPAQRVTEILIAALYTGPPFL